jgi:hypothetical protein
MVGMMGFGENRGRQLTLLTTISNPKRVNCFNTLAIIERVTDCSVDFDGKVESPFLF